MGVSLPDLSPRRAERGCGPVTPSLPVGDVQEASSSRGWMGACATRPALPPEKTKPAGLQLIVGIWALRLLLGTRYQPRGLLCTPLLPPVPSPRRLRQLPNQRPHPRAKSSAAGQWRGEALGELRAAAPGEGCDPESAHPVCQHPAGRASAHVTVGGLHRRGSKTWNISSGHYGVGPEAWTPGAGRGGARWGSQRPEQGCLASSP